MEWALEHWFDLLSSIGIVGSLALAVVSLRSETKTRRIENLLTLTENHREIWTEEYRNPDLKRVRDPSADLRDGPITLAESSFVNLVIQHLNGAFEALKSGLTIKPEALRQDVRQFFSLPIPQAVWQKLKDLQNDDFADFVDQCLDGTN